MRIISKKILKAYYTSEPMAESSLLSWIAAIEDAEFKNHNELKSQFRNASIIDDKRVIFNIHGNKYRLIVKIEYDFDLVFITWLGTHSQYDKIDATTINYKKPD
jgi:mRNA interferase HigB